MMHRFAAALYVSAQMLSGMIVMAEESTSYPANRKNDVFLAQAQSTAPSVGGSSQGSAGLDLPEFSPPSASPDAPGVRANLNDVDLSRQLTPPRQSRSLSQFASANRSSNAFRPTNIFGDTFGGQGSHTTFVIPITYAGVQGVDLGNGDFGFDVGGSTALDVFAGFNSNSTTSLSVIEPINPTGAFVPSEDGIDNFQFGGGTATQVDSLGNEFDVTYFYSTTTATSGPSSTTALVGRQKIAENVSPIPTNRLFVNYSYFDRTPLGGGTDVRRWAPGFESLVFNEETSLEMRLPMAVTLSSNNFADGDGVEAYEVGNLYLALKRLIYRSEQTAISIGTSLTLPTGNDINIFVRSQTFGQRQILKIENQSVHILPFVGWYRGNERFFTQGFAQVDIDTNGNSVSFNPNFQFNQLSEVGRLQDANFMYLDVQSGVWLKRLSPSDSCGKSGNGFTGISAISELHWNRSLNSEDNIFFPSAVSFGNPRTDVQTLNALVGMNFEHNFRTNVGVGYATPIGNGADHEFKGEWRLFFNRYF